MGIRLEILSRLPNVRFGSLHAGIMRVTSTCLLACLVLDNTNAQFSDKDADDLDYNSMLAMPSADVLAQLIALSQMNAANSGNKKKNKNKRPVVTKAPVAAKPAAAPAASS